LEDLVDFPDGGLGIGLIEWFKIRKKHEKEIGPRYIKHEQVEEVNNNFGLKSPTSNDLKHLTGKFTYKIPLHTRCPSNHSDRIQSNPINHSHCDVHLID
jgi:hypothetical protein